MKSNSKPDNLNELSRSRAAGASHHTHGKHIRVSSRHVKKSEFSQAERAEYTASYEKAIPNPATAP